MIPIGLNQAEQKAGGKYYDQDKVKGVNKTVGDKVKDKFQEVTGYSPLLDQFQNSLLIFYTYSHSLPGTK